MPEPPFATLSLNVNCDAAAEPMFESASGNVAVEPTTALAGPDFITPSTGRCSVVPGELTGPADTNPPLDDPLTVAEACRTLPSSAVNALKYDWSLPGPRAGEPGTVHALEALTEAPGARSANPDACAEVNVVTCPSGVVNATDKDFACPAIEPPHPHNNCQNPAETVLSLNNPCGEVST